MHGPVPSPTSSPTHTPTSVEEVVAGFLAGTLPREAWTHPAHLFVCQHLLRTATPAEVLAELRGLIPAHNARVGVRPHHGGYHETVTRYYVEAVASLGAAASTADLLADARCQRDAPLRHWSAPLLGSKTARATWVEPDLEPVPWT